ncbi:DUF2207 domain-containing protein [Amycolatopsis sp. FDAARGOS 1241]|uniref:DUF2207 domain-containing protein n=1 Tax=Amycolatopsis sp. FDAARGOS 1241 TaxID=2778070 RepID=UPI001EF3D359|nr:DUF2207 domain-containing protein [Amycolatopsis sp. FDAARGOS 1241]
MLIAPALGVTATATAHPDGSVTVVERVTTTAPATHRIALRVPVTDDENRVYTVRDARVTGAGHLTEDAGGITAGYTGDATLTYTVDGAVAGGGQVRWPVTGGWDQDLTTLTARLSAPGIPTSPISTPPISASPISTVDCYAGAAGSARHCTFSELGAGGVATVEQDGLRRGDRVDLVVQVPPGALAENARFVRVSPVTDFLTGPGIPLVALAVLLAGAAATWLRRRRETRQRVLARA